jgi:hypothetical protein
MLTRGDEFPIHQTADPIAYSGTDPNFYDRYFFNGYAPDGSEFFAAAFGVYPHIGVADAHFAIIRDGVLHCVHASRVLVMERMDLSVGPISLEVHQPLQRLTLRVAETDGISAELTFDGRAFPIEEPRFTHRRNARMFMDVTRFTQNGRWSGWIEVDGKRTPIAVGSTGTRDRSWGVRFIGLPDPRPEVPAIDPQFFWLWSPMNFPTRSVYYHLNADRHGKPWNTRAVVVADGAGPPEFHQVEDAIMSLEMRTGTRHAVSSTLRLTGPEGRPLRADVEPLHHFPMRGIGYGHPKWSHGVYHSPLEVEREDIDLSVIDPLALTDLHIQAVSRITLVDEEAETTEVGIGVLEQLIVGPYDPLGLTGIADPA